MLRLKVLFNLYRWRVREHPVQEALAGLGIAAGVALVCAVQIANSSIVGSASEMAHAVTGTADLQLVARDPHGFDERLIEQVREAPGVARAAPLLEQRAVLSGAGGGHVPVEIASADPSLLALTSSFDPGGLALLGDGIMLSANAAKAMGLPTTAGPSKRGAQRRIYVEIRGRSTPVPVVAVVGPETIGPLAGADLAIAALPYLQGIADLPGRVTRVLVQSAPGRQAEVRDSLEAVAGGRLTVASTDSDLDLLRGLVRPNDQASAFFAAISALAGLLFAFNAMLLTAPERRQLVANLRRQGFPRRQVVQLVLFEATLLGAFASAVGLVAGLLLSSTLFDGAPAYVAAAFPLGTDTTVTVQPLLLSALGGIAATWIAAAFPLLDLRRSRASDAVFDEEGEPGHALAGGVRRALLVAALLVLGICGAIMLATPTAAVLACIGLALATVLALPSLFAAAIAAGQWLSERAQRLPALTIAVSGLRDTMLRSLALATTGAVAVFGSVAIGNAHQDLLRGLYRSYGHYVNTADLWIVQRSDDLATKSFADRGLVTRVDRVPGAERVRPYYGGFLDVAGQRVWVIGRSAADRMMIPSSEIVEGTLQEGSRRLRTRGWITVSDQLAASQHVAPGDALTLPTPTGAARFRVAATTTNLGWPGGAIVVNDRDYRRRWGEPDPTAIELDLAPGADPAETQRAVRGALGDEGSGLQVQSARQRAEQANALARQAVARLGQISVMLLITAALAMAAAMGSAIWQRRRSLAALRADGFRGAQIRRILFIETGIVLAVGCSAGASAGILGEFLMDRYLRLTSGFPVSFSPTGSLTVGTVLAVMAAALVVVAIPIAVMARTPPQVRFQE